MLFKDGYQSLISQIYDSETKYLDGVDLFYDLSGPEDAPAVVTI